ncbi:hypothetical protein AB0C27_53645 [Nonomuraea sp. NPDC048882]|uniref:hypothetical protein n=1 Tax=Nonomuraea sp. NPDC048882 TaxID=3154347 RepID=UPI00340F1C45
MVDDASPRREQKVMRFEAGRAPVRLSAAFSTQLHRTITSPLNQSIARLQNTLQRTVAADLMRMPAVSALHAHAAGLAQVRKNAIAKVQERETQALARLDLAKLLASSRINVTLARFAESSSSSLNRALRSSAQQALAGLQPGVIARFDAEIQTTISSAWRQMAHVTTTRSLSESFSAAILSPFAPRCQAIINEWASAMSSRLAPLFRSWGVPDVLAKLIRFKNSCYLAMLAVRTAVRAGDLTPVRNFLHEHLGFRRSEISEDQVQALALTLLADDWNDDLDVYDDAALRSRLRQRARYGTDFIGDHQVQRRRIRYLDSPLEPYLRHPVTVEDEVLARIMPIDNPRILLVLDRLRPAERRIALDYALNPPESWEQVAAYSGQAADRGESVRRKLRREGRVVSQRLHSR